MIQVDYRIGSGEFEPLLKNLGLTVTVGTLHCGDFCFLGQGVGGEPVPVGVERKTIKDLLTSSQSGRLTQQLEAMLLCYQDIWVVVEGVYRRGKSGIVEVPMGKGWEPLTFSETKVQLNPKQVMYREVESLILTLEERGGARIRKTRSKLETGQFIGDLYHWWTSKSLEDHRSHLRLRTNDADQALLVKPSLCRQVAALLPGIGWKKSGVVSSYFPSVRAMVMAPADEWKKIQGVGKLMAERIDKELGG